MSEGSSGEPERDQDPWSQQADSAPPAPAAAQPEAAGHSSAGPDSWSTTWVYPASPAPDSWSTTWTSPGSPARPTGAGQPDGSDWTSQQIPPPSAASQDGYQPPPEQYPQQAGQHGYQPPPEQYPHQGGQHGYQPNAGQYPAPAGQYGPPQWPVYPAGPRNNRVAIAALVCGVGQFVLGLLVVGNILLAIPAIICGAIGVKQINRRGEGGRGMAIAGLVLGILGVVYFVIIVVVLIIIGSIHHSGSG